jgi:acyl-CoA synthetase (AMP-forming)/AMP-acid ligase II
MAEILDEDAAARRAGSVLDRLAARGVHAGDRIAVIAGNGAPFVAVRDAAIAADLVLAPVNPRLAPAEIAWILGHARPRAVLVDPAREAVAPDGAIVIDDDDDDGAPAAVDHARTGATLLYTSGTTGRP